MERLDINYKNFLDWMTNTSNEGELFAKQLNAIVPHHSNPVFISIDKSHDDIRDVVAWIQTDKHLINAFFFTNFDVDNTTTASIDTYAFEELKELEIKMGQTEKNRFDILSYTFNHNSPNRLSLNRQVNFQQSKINVDKFFADLCNRYISK